MGFVETARAVCAVYLSLTMSATQVRGQGTAAPKALNIVIVEGEGAINNLRQRVAREPIVQVEDENRKPVAGTIVIFMLPQNGASGAFADGSQTFSVVTGADGRAAARGITTNNVKGDMQIRVTASALGLTASAVITMRTAAPAVAVSAKTWTIVGIIAAAAVIGIVVATTQGGGTSTSPGTPTPPPIQVGIGTPIVTPPR